MRIKKVKILPPHLYYCNHRDKAFTLVIDLNPCLFSKLYVNSTADCPYAIQTSL